MFIERQNTSIIIALYKIKLHLLEQTIVSVIPFVPLTPEVALPESKFPANLTVQKNNKLDVHRAPKYFYYNCSL
ncbi:MAG: hypothetical protein F6K23_22040 [Okeania sp. SIO2C9]|uniref:hypothetical protein n=1 Tax=Okeania sp. SIO2C9 TaxID=2607791 RepID=UPI0013BFEB26|nr:hypothetical protein [Okeania sp. SIO2C9]NEQ75496.1 hypothetical protein [Okeania sp. SIO2C9]